MLVRSCVVVGSADLGRSCDAARPAAASPASPVPQCVESVNRAEASRLQVIVPRRYCHGRVSPSGCLRRLCQQSNSPK